MTETDFPVKKLASHECHTMTDVRYEVDRLDIILVSLLAERQTYMNAAARIKQSKNLVRDEARIEEVVKNVLQNARKYDLSPKIAEPVWRLLIEKCIEYEMGEFTKK